MNSERVRKLIPDIPFAVELGLGITGPDQIELLTSDSDSADFAKKIRPLLN